MGQGHQKDSLPGDLLHKDSIHIIENLLIQQQDLLKADSALRVQLEAELKKGAGNQSKTRDLQSQLARILSNDSMKRLGQLQQIQALKKYAEGHPVVLNEDTLFLLYTKMGSFGAAERAAAISGRISKLYRDYSFKADSLNLLSTGNGFDITYKNDLTIMSVSQLDALWFGFSADSLASAYRKTIATEILKQKKENNLYNWLRRIGWMALILVSLSVFIFLINRLYRRSVHVIRANRERLAHGLTFRKYRLVTPEKLEHFLIRASSVARFIIIVLAAYIALLLVSGIFTATEKWTATLLGWILTPARSVLHSIVHFLPNLFTIIVIYFIFRYVIKGIHYLSGEVGKGHMQISGFHPEWAQPTFNIIKFLLYAFMAVLIFPYLPGSASPAFKGVSVFLGVLVSLGSSSAINNIVAGLVITYMRPFHVGDRVQIGDVTGDVIEKTMLVIRIRTIKNEDVTVPNSAVLSTSSINFSSCTKPTDTGLILHSTVTIGYDTPWKKFTMLSLRLPKGRK
ncbi:mechanosensitive ion channel family protein [Puia sp. P3]|uniref:mechanosensitive ion channel family protein n=1 Tax=Puia sp. P3 TaxID=3423952 RepID=UPI003D677500